MRRSSTKWYLVQVEYMWEKKKKMWYTRRESLIYSQYYKHHGMYNSKQAQKQKQLKLPTEDRREI